MKLIDENYKGNDVRSDKTDAAAFYFEYDPQEEDFFLRRRMYWDYSDEEQWFRLSIGSRFCDLPESLFLMVGDVYSTECDWIQVGELLGRKNITTFVYPINMDGDWLVESVSVAAVLDKADVQFPSTKNILPVALGSDKMVMVAKKDEFSRTKHIDMTSL